MNTRRSFFQRIAGLVAAVAIAPEIAFRTKLALPEATLPMEVTIATWFSAPGALNDGYGETEAQSYGRKHFKMAFPDPYK